MFSQPIHDCINCSLASVYSSQLYGHCPEANARFIGSPNLPSMQEDIWSCWFFAVTPQSLHIACKQYIHRQHICCFQTSGTRWISILITVSEQQPVCSLNASDTSHTPCLGVRIQDKGCAVVKYYTRGPLRRSLTCKEGMPDQVLNALCASVQMDATQTLISSRLLSTTAAGNCDGCKHLVYFKRKNPDEHWVRFYINGYV